jgi:hypothetical protein
MTEHAALISALSNERWRLLLLPLLEPDQKVRDTAVRELQSALRARPTKDDPLWPSAADALRLIEIGMTVTFPPSSRTWERTATHDILFWFVTMNWPRLVGKIAEHFATAGDDVRLDALTILAAQHTEEALRTLGALVDQHGLPKKIYSRLWWELNASYVFADHLMPQLVLRAGPHMPAVMDFVNLAHERGSLTPATLIRALPLIEREVAERFPKVLARQRRGGPTRWQFKEKYARLSHQFGAYLDLLSLIPGSSTRVLEQATACSDPYLLSVVIRGLLRRGMEPPREVVRTAAASHVARSHLYRALEGFGRLDLYPPEAATFESFAAAHMAQWLQHPSELGYEPQRLELAATLRGTNDQGVRQWCLWRFEGDGGALYAAVSGPYELKPPDGPLEGNDVFSNFADWDSATPEQHLQSVLDTLRDWRVHRSGT